MTRDLSNLTDEELLALAGPQQAPAKDISALSDKELLAMAGQQTPRDPSFLERLGRAGIPERGTGILPSREALSSVGEAALEIGPGLGELAVGAVQRGAEVLGQEDFSRRLGQQQAREREALTPTQKAGRVAGQIIGTAPIAAGGALLPGVVKGAGAISALTPTEEGTAEAAVKQIGTGIGAGLATLGVLKGTGAAAVKVKQLSQEGIKRVKAGLGAKTVEELGEAATRLKEKSSNVYQAMRDIDASITQKAGTKLVTNLDDTLTKSGKLNPRLHGDTLSVVRDIRGAAQKGDIGLEELDQYRQLLNQVTTKNTDIAGSVNADGQKATLLINKLDDLVEGLKPNDLGVGGKQATELLSQARSDWKTFKKFQKITNVVEKAGGDPNRTKAAFQRFVANKKNLRGFTKDERDALIFAAENTGGEKILKTLGKFGIDLGTSLTPGNTFLPAASVFAGALSGSAGGGVATAAAGTAARSLQKLVASGKVDDALRLIQEGGIKNVPEVISKISNQKARQELLTRLFLVGAAQQTTQ
jgi:hypothetical protein